MIVWINEYEELGPGACSYVGKKFIHRGRIQKRTKRGFSKVKASFELLEKL